MYFCQTQNYVAQLLVGGVFLKMLAFFVEPTILGGDYSLKLTGQIPKRKFIFQPLIQREAEGYSKLLLYEYVCEFFWIWSVTKKLNFSPFS